MSPWCCVILRTNNSVTYIMMQHNLFSTKYGFQTILFLVFFIENATAAGGIFGLKALTGNMPYLGTGNPWITYPRIADGAAGLYSPYWPNYGGYSGAEIYGPYQSYLYGGSGGPQLRGSVTFQSRIPSSSSGGSGSYYKGRGNPWIARK